MSTTVTDEDMTSDVTRHTARKVNHSDMWAVSWLPPHRLLSRNQATTAMVLAEWVATYWDGARVVGIEPEQFRLLVSGWADELGLSRHEVIEQINS